MKTSSEVRTSKIAATPGPWKIRPCSHEGCGTIRAGRHMAVEVHESANAEADTRLIAAAPELLAALQTLVNSLCPYDTVPECWANAMAAIAKATGGAA